MLTLFTRKNTRRHWRIIAAACGKGATKVRDKFYKDHPEYSP